MSHWLHASARGRRGLTPIPVDSDSDDGGAPLYGSDGHDSSNQNPTVSHSSRNLRSTAPPGYHSDNMEERYNNFMCHFKEGLRLAIAENSLSAEDRGRACQYLLQPKEHNLNHLQSALDEWVDCRITSLEGFIDDLSVVIKLLKELMYTRGREITDSDQVVNYLLAMNLLTPKIESVMESMYVSNRGT